MSFIICFAQNSTFFNTERRRHLLIFMHMRQGEKIYVPFASFFRFFKSSQRIGKTQFSYIHIAARRAKMHPHSRIFLKHLVQSYFIFLLSHYFADFATYFFHKGKINKSDCQYLCSILKIVFFFKKKFVKLLHCFLYYVKMNQKTIFWRET